MKFSHFHVFSSTTITRRTFSRGLSSGNSTTFGWRWKTLVRLKLATTGCTAQNRSKTHSSRCKRRRVRRIRRSLTFWHYFLCAFSCWKFALKRDLKKRPTNENNFGLFWRQQSHKFNHAFTPTTNIYFQPLLNKFWGVGLMFYNQQNSKAILGIAKSDLNHLLCRRKYQCVANFLFF